MNIKPEEIRRLLVRGTNWVGDAVMSVPAMREIRKIFSKAHISLLVRPWVSDVYAAADFVDDLLPYDNLGRHAGLGGKMRLSSELRGQRFDAAILLQNAFDAAAIAWLAGIPIRIGYARDWRSPLLTHACRIDPAVRDVHQVYYYLGILADLGCFQPRSWEDASYLPPISIGVRKEDRDSAESLLRAAGIDDSRPVIAINPGAAYGSAKRWFEERYSQVADLLVQKHGARIILVGSAVERSIAEKVARGMKNSAAVLAGKTTLGQLMGLLSNCRLLITNDSGPMHLAAALNVPQLAIFGSTSEIATGPLSQNAEVIKEQVDCNPCFLRECPIDFRCMTRISVERVYTRAARKLEG